MSATHSRSQDVASTLRTEILRNQYRVGERLPSERDLSARFGVNRGAIREALKQLEQLGIISIQPGGARVVPKEEATLEILGHLLSLDEYPDPKLLDQFLLVFKVFCVMSAENAITQASPAQLLAIETTVNELKINIGDDTAMRLSWTELFDYFFTINDNLVMRLITNGLKGQLLERMKEFEPQPQADQQALMEIINKLEHAIKNRDPIKLGNTIAQYFEFIRGITAAAFANIRPSTQIEELEALQNCND